MEKSKIVNPAIKDIWSRSLWTGQPDVSKSLRVVSLILYIAAIVVAFGLAFPFFAKLGENFIIILAAVFLLFITLPIVKIAKRLRWKDSLLMFAISDGCIFFTHEPWAKLKVDRDGSWFEESIHNITGFTRKTDGGKTTVIIKFAEKSYAGSYGNIKELPLYRISNPQQLISTLTGLGIKEEKKSDKK
jgi:hypothetical protein